MSQNNRSNNASKPANASFAALVLTLGLIIIAVIIGLSSLNTPLVPEKPLITLVGRNLNYRPSSTPTPTASSTRTPTNTPTATHTPRPTATPTDTPTATGTPDTASRVRAGENVFQSVCYACHGFDAQGISGLGPSFHGNVFVNSHTNEELLAFVKVGRPVTDPANTTGVQMPPRGGNPSLSDEDLIDVIAYIRSLNPGAQIVESGGAPAATLTPTPTRSAPLVAMEFTPLSLSALGAPAAVATSSGAAPDAFLAGAANTYSQSCAGCHGDDGTGVTMMAAPLAGSALFASRNGIGLYEMLVHPDPALGFPHPYRGGYPELTDDQILALIGYLYTLDGGQP